MSVWSVALAWVADLSAALAGCSEYESHVDVAVSNFLSETCVSRVEQSTRLRSVFMDVEMTPMAPVPGHTHGGSAARRSTASLFIESVASSSGKDVVFRQGSASDVRNGRTVTRSWFWAKDTAVEPQQRSKQDNDLVAMVDVDYYVDMPKFLSRHFRPIILYTFQPSSVSKDDGEYKYTANADGTFTYLVSGGGTYRHAVWNYKGDTVSAERKFFGIPLTYSTFALERRMVDEDHQVIMLSPLVKASGISAWVAKWKAPAAPLTRVNVVEGEFTRVTINGTEGLMVHTGRAGGYVKAVVPASADDTIASAMRASKIKLTLAAIKSKMAGPAGVTTGAEILHEYHLGKSPKVPDLVNTLSDGVRRFQWTEKMGDYDDDAKPGMVAFMAPLLHGAFVPDNCHNNDKRMVEHRVKKLVNTTKITPFILKTVEEFVVRLTLGEKHFLDPVDIEEVYRRQAKPSQRAILDRADQEDAERRAKMFMKREGYQKVNDPRGITTINGADKRDYSTFIYAAADVVKLCKWYAFSKTPMELAERVAEICERSERHVDGTDFSRMDGRVSDVPRYLESVLMKRLFRTEHHGQLSDLMRSQHSLPGKTRNGVSYETGLSRLSGSAETSLFNTVLNAYTAFLAFRMSPGIAGGFMSPAEAWDRLGVYGGDDGLTADLSSSKAEKAAGLVGQVLTAERTKRGEIGVSFLARHYGPDVWFGDVNSCCDIARTLSKFHVTVHLPSNVSSTDKLFEKAYALSLTDRLTPVVGDFVRQVLSHFPKRKYQNLLEIWRSDVPSESQYPNSVGCWATDLLLKQLPDFDENTFYWWVKDASVKELLNCPMLTPAVDVGKIKGLAVVDGDFHGASASDDSTSAAIEDCKAVKPKPVSTHPTKNPPRTSAKVVTPTPSESTDAESVTAGKRKRHRPRKAKQNRPSRSISQAEPTKAGPKQAPKTAPTKEAK